jgi:hypothetical protein
VQCVWQVERIFVSTQPDSTDFSSAFALRVLIEDFDDWWRDYLPILLSDSDDKSLENANEEVAEEKLKTEFIN